jgi:hypothetical protein
MTRVITPKMPKHLIWKNREVQLPVNQMLKDKIKNKYLNYTKGFKNTNEKNRDQN